MILILVRHAQAAERSEAEYPDDTLRPLVSRGKRAQGRVSRWLVERGFVPTVVLSSPWRRAWQTAGVLAREAGLEKAARVACPALATDPGLDALAQAIGTRGEDEVVALVGHEPWIGELASLLLTGSPTRLAVEFPKSAVMGIEIPTVGAAAGRLLFFHFPRRD